MHQPVRRRPSRRRQEVVHAVEDLHAMGMMRAEIARHLNMDEGGHGGLARALQRARRYDLLAAITPPDWHQMRQALAEQARGREASGPRCGDCAACGVFGPTPRRGWCSRCYRAWYAAGKPETGPPLRVMPAMWVKAMVAVQVADS